MGEGDQTQPHCKDKRDLLTIKQGEDWWTESHKGTKRKGDSGQIAFDKAFAGDRASSGGTDGKESACSARDSHPLSSAYLPTFNLSQHQGLFQ